MQHTLIGYQKKDYVSKATGKQVNGVNLFLACQSSYADVEGQEVCTEFVKPELVNGFPLTVGGKYDIEFGKGFGGKAVVARITPVKA